ncbi:MAG: DUF3604 domain-containing protein [Xanthomonadales bacterium]|nr:DUF3604 domain-containing protein [Xanthomonadales bacterium]NIN60278.1 DUF3604 domain-containing protein [Xanthomonadales bacterium]NIN75630.1 DUF3604 domain-containing protein [Xanthomonadales bacterium]NIO14703.1 DUF3604 domain-containing protein [Xanthomonadales bacterium]NIP12671.1 DUF3604 domain-containing protein [Xanthomonadales bacterium]
MNRLITAAILASTLCFLNTASLAQDTGLPPEEEPERTDPELPYSPYATGSAATRVFWGDTHLHTSYSMDAGAFGNRLGLDEAYRFARGEEIDSTTAGRVRLARPLDFLVIADHSDNMGFFPDLFAANPAILEDPKGKEWYDMIQAGEGMAVALQIIDSFSRGTFPNKLMYWPDGAMYRSAWDKTIAAAERYNEPGRFTAFIGYEWTSQVPPGQNLHRVVIYKDGADKASQTVPATTYPPQGSTDPEYLWSMLQAYEDKTGGDLLAIAHNGNLSNGLMFPLTNHVDGKPITREYAKTRAMWEPLYEVTQIKGDGEAHPLLSPNDEFADYGTWDKGNLNLSEAKSNDMLAHEYARSALALGLQIEQDLGTNPYKFGMIGSTDSHTSLATADEDNFFGKHSGSEPSPERMKHPFAKFGDLAIYGWETVASGYAAVWATENTREALFDAMARRETYATTGPRMLVRFFGGWDFDEADKMSRQPAVVGYQKGVPMGGDLTKAPAGKSPTFLVAALKDAIGANLDRIQIIKGWIDKDGNSQERIYDVAVSDDRQIDADGRCRTPVGNTVSLETATWSNTIGATELIEAWTDPDFDPDLAAFYYVRVIEIPTPRWTAYDAKYYGVDFEEGDSGIHQERAYTSPIWYTP